MIRATNAAVRFLYISENESLSNAFRADAFQADSGSLGSVSWRGNGCGAGGNGCGKGSFIKLAPIAFGSQHGYLSMLTVADRPIELEDISKESRTVNKTTYRSGEFERTDAIPA